MNVLLVEDDPVVPGILVQWLESRGHSVRTAASLNEAWAAYAEQPVPLLVVEVILGGESGYDFCRRVRRHPEGRDCIILVVTVKRTAEDLREALDAGVDDFLPQPADADIFRLRMTIAEERVKSRRERAEQAAALRVSEERFRELVNHIHEVFWISSPDRQDIMYISPAVRDIWGVVPADIYRNTGLLTLFIHPEDEGRVTGLYPLPPDLRFAAVEYRLCGPSGETRFIRERAFPIRDKDGAVVRLVGVSEDITEAREAEQQSHLAQQRQMELAQRTSHLASLGLLAAGVAHEINNPLQGMISHLRIARRKVVDGSEAASSLAMVEMGIRTVAELVDKMLVLGRVPNHRDEISTFTDSIDFVLQLLAGKLRQRNIVVEHSSDCKAKRVSLRISRSELTQILINLVVNACDAMPTGGTIRIGCDEADGYGILRVSDTGMGIEPGQLEQIFTPFYTSKGTQGTGLGLSISESIVRQCDGQINVTSRQGEGTEFVVRLPSVGSPVAGREMAS